MTEEVQSRFITDRALPQRQSSLALLALKALEKKVFNLYLKKVSSFTSSIRYQEYIITRLLPRGSIYPRPNCPGPNCSKPHLPRTHFY